MRSLEPNLQALVDGNGDAVTITRDQVDQVNVFLDALSTYASASLKDDIQIERERHPLQQMIGLSMEDAWDYINGYNLKWLTPKNVKDTYVGRAGRTIPPQFRIETQDGEFVTDVSVTVQVVGGEGEIVLGPFELAKNPAKGIVVQDQKYHLNLKTKGLKPGQYTVEVFYNSVNPGEPESKDLRLR